MVILIVQTGTYRNCRRTDECAVGKSLTRLFTFRGLNKSQRRTVCRDISGQEGSGAVSVTNWCMIVILFQFQNSKTFENRRKKNADISHKAVLDE